MTELRARWCGWPAEGFLTDPHLPLLGCCSVCWGNVPRYGVTQGEKRMNNSRLCHHSNLLFTYFWLFIYFWTGSPTAAPPRHPPYTHARMHVHTNTHTDTTSACSPSPFLRPWLELCHAGLWGAVCCRMFSGCVSDLHKKQVKVDPEFTSGEQCSLLNVNSLTEMTKTEKAHWFVCYLQNVTNFLEWTHSKKCWIKCILLLTSSCSTEDGMFGSRLLDLP